MNEKDKEYAGQEPQLTESPVQQDATSAQTSETPTAVVQEACVAESTNDVCAEDASPAMSLAEAAEELDPADNEADSEEKEPSAITVQADAEPERINYHSFSKEQLVDALRQIVEANDASAHKKVAAIKQAFYQLRNREIEAEMDEHVENGNPPENFTASVDEAEVNIKELLGQFRELRSQYLSAEEVRRQENLELKRKIIEQLRQLADDIDNINLHFPKFQQLQTEFKAITEIPAGDVADTWKSYQLAVEQFYDRLKMNKELRDLDFRKNLEYKRTLIEQAKALESEPDPVAAFRKLQDLHEKWRETGPVAKEIRESIWDEFKAASTVINKRHQEFFEARKAAETANEEVKTKLCEELESIDMDALTSFKEWDKETQHVLDLQAQWKKLGFASRKVNTQLFNRFRKVCDEFFQRKGAYYKTVKDEYATNMAKKVALCEQAEALRENGEDYKKALEKIGRLQEEWRKVGPVQRKNSDAIWQRFNEACNYFYQQRKNATAAVRQEENANLAAKRAIIAALKALDSEDGERNQTIGQVRELQRQWNQTGHVPFRQKDSLYAEYRQACDALYSKFDIRHQQARMLNFEEQLADIDSDKGKLMHERERLSRAYEAKKAELSTAENNMGFFNVKSSAGNSLIRDMERRIKRLREDLELIAQKISAVNNKLNS